MKQAIELGKIERVSAYIQSCCRSALEQGTYTKWCRDAAAATSTVASEDGDWGERGSNWGG